MCSNKILFIKTSDRLDLVPRSVLSDPALDHGVKFFCLLIWPWEMRTSVQSLLNKHGFKFLPLHAIAQLGLLLQDLWH